MIIHIQVHSNVLQLLSAVGYASITLSVSLFYQELMDLHIYLNAFELPSPPPPPPNPKNMFGGVARVLVVTNEF